MDPNWREAGEPPRKRFVMEYLCKQCDEAWTDMWFHVVNDRCPRCNSETDPTTVEDILIPLPEEGG